MFSCPLLRFTGVFYDKLVKYERWVFLLFLLITLLQLWLTKYIPSLDGPQHLYNANVMVELLKGNELMRSFFDINEVIVGYWTGHFFLAFFKLFFPAWLAEKLFLTLYVVAMVLSFRYLVRMINPSKGNFVAFLIFPFVYHSYLLLGYYSFSIAAIFFFLGFAYWIRYRDEMNWKRMAVFGMILIGLFLSHGLVYIFFGTAFSIFFITTTIYRIVAEKDEFRIKHALVSAARAMVAVVPSLVLWIIYIRSVMSINDAVAEAPYGLTDLLKFLIRIRQLVGFDHQLESYGYIPLFVLMALLTIVFLVIFAGGLKDKTTKLISILTVGNSWIFIALAFLGLYFFAPDRISAGNLTNRFGLFFFLAFITWLSVQKFPKTFQVISLLVILLSISYSRYVHHHYYKQLNKDIAELQELSDYVEPNSVMTYQRASDNWLHIHFQLYTAVDDPIVHLKNPQCQGQFPVVWNLEELPRCFAGEKEVIPAGAIRQEGKSYSQRYVDYITIFYNDKYWSDSTNSVWQEIIRKNYEEIYVSSKGKGALWRIKPGIGH